MVYVAGPADAVVDFDGFDVVVGVPWPSTPAAKRQRPAASRCESIMPTGAQRLGFTGRPAERETDRSAVKFVQKKPGCVHGDF
jgi:hypothetical protein